MKLIVDSGSTKTQWAVLDGDNVVESFYSQGFNPYYMNAEAIGRSIGEGLPASMASFEIGQIYFYGTGCSTSANCKLVQSILLKFFKKATISTHHDLYGAAVALLNERKGIACILGTGSNSCLWDGHRVVENVPSLGFLLGDEGGAIYLGKLLLKKIMGGSADEEITKAFYEFVGLSFTEILHTIYKNSDSNRWIAGLATFVSANIEHPQMKEIARKNFQDFIENQISKYSGFKDLEISYLGSVAYYLQNILREVMKDFGLKTGTIIKGPMEGLIEYHRRK